MSWGIAETASEIEKIKSESADYLNGLNSCGVIDWNTYNYAFDFYADLLMKAYKQGEKDAQHESYESDEAAKRLNDLIFDVNPAEICSQIESDNLINWCKTIQTEMKMAMVQLPCWAERRIDE